MSTLNAFKRMILINPISIILVSLFVFVLCAIEQHLLFPLLYGVLSLNSWDISNSIVSLIQLLSGIIYGKFFITIIGQIGLILVGLAVLISIVFSGLFYTAYCIVETEEKIREKMFFGGIHNIIRISIISLTVLIAGVFLVNVFLIASVPSVLLMAVSKAMVKVEYHYLWAFTAILSFFVFYFLFTYYRLYSFFWYISSANFVQGCFSIGKKLADTYFWKIVRKIMLFDFVLVLFEILILLINNKLEGASDSLLLLFGNWIFKTLFIIIFIIKFFSMYKSIKQELVYIKPELRDNKMFL